MCFYEAALIAKSTKGAGLTFISIFDIIEAEN